MKEVLEDLAELRETLKVDPDNAAALCSVGRNYLKQGYYKLAKNHYIQAVRSSPHLLPQIILDFEREIEKGLYKIGPRLSFAGFLLERGELDHTILELEEALELHPKCVEAYNVLGKIYIKQELTDSAILLLEKSIKEGVRDIGLIEILARAYLEKDRIQEAAKFYQEVLDYRAGDKHILRVLWELYTRLENYDQAAKCYQAMFSEDPEVSREVMQRLEELLKKQEGSIFIREILAQIYMQSLFPEKAVGKLQEIICMDNTRLNEVVDKFKMILKNYPAHPEASLRLADALRTQGNFSEAAECLHNLAKAKPELLPDVISGYSEILRYCPEQILARSYLAEAYLYRKQIKEALLEFENMIRVDKGSGEMVVRKCREILKTQPHLLLAHLVLGRAYMIGGDIQRAIVEAEGIIAIDKRFTPAYLLLGEAYFSMKLGRKAAETLGTALSIDPYNLLVQQSYQAVKEKELDLEINSIKDRLNKDPWKGSLHLDLAKLYIRRGESDQAIRELQLALKDPVRAPFALNLLGCIYRGEGRFDLAAAQFNRALELASPEIADFSTTVRFNLGTTYEAHGVVRKALKIYEGVLQENIDFGGLKRKVKYLKQTSLQSMCNKSLLAVASNFGEPNLIAFWGRVGKLRRNGRKDEINVSFGQSHNTSGFDFFMKGMYKAAQEEFQLAVQLDSRFAVVLNNWAISLAKEGRFVEARSKLEEAVHLDPSSALFRNNLGLIYFLLGCFDLAKGELERARELDPDLSAVYINLGDVYYLKKEIESALKLYQMIGKFDILSEIAEQRLIYKVP